MFSQCLGPRSKTWPQISPDCFIAHWRRKKNCNSNHENNQAAGTANNKNETNSQVIEDFQSQVPKKRTIIKFVEVSYLELCPRGYGAFNFSLGHATPKNHPTGLSTSSCRGRPRSAPAPLLPSSSQQAVIVVYCWDWHELAFFGFVMFET